MTFLKLIDPRTLPAEFVEEIRRYKFRGSSGKVNLALDALPDFTCLPGPGAHLRGAISISPSVELHGARLRRCQVREFLEAPVHRHGDPDAHRPFHCAARQAHPVVLRPVRALQAGTGNWDDRREEFGDTVINTIAEYAPNIKNIIRHRQVLTPLDIEREFGP